MPKILHITESFLRIGGVETILNNWIKADAQSAGLAMLDINADSNLKTRKYGLRKSKLDSLSCIKKNVVKMNLKCNTIISHNFSGLHSLSGLIEYDRIFAYLHSNSLDILTRVNTESKYVDGYIVGSEKLAEDVERLLGSTSISTYPINCPIDADFFNKCKKRKRRKIIIGYAGRLENEQKKVKRLHDLCRCLDQREILFRLQIAGEGTQEKKLRKLLSAFPVEFLGPLNKNKLINAFRSWDFQIITSDYETGPMSVFEGIASGVIPILPNIDCQAKDLLLEKHNDLIYTKGNMNEAAEQIKKCFQLPAKTLDIKRSMLRDTIKNRSIERYLNDINKFLKMAAPNAKKEKIKSQQDKWSDHLPLSIQSRFWPGPRFLK